MNRGAVLGMLGWLAAAGWAGEPVMPGSKPDIASEIRAELFPVQFTTLSSEMTGRILQLPVKEWESFQKNDLLVVFACEREMAMLDKAEAQHKAASSRFRVSQRLSERHAASVLEVEVVEAEVAQAQAEIRLARDQVSHCRIHAPFAGRVGELAVREHQVVKAGDRLLEILDPARLEARFLLPSHWVHLYQPGDTFQLQVFETGKRYPMTLLRFGARMDAVSQSIKAIASLANPQGDLLPGMSGLVLPTAEGTSKP